MDLFQRPLQKVKQRRSRLKGHAIQHHELILYSVALQEPLHGHAIRGRPRMIYLDGQKLDIGFQDCVGHCGIDEEVGPLEAACLWFSGVPLNSRIHQHEVPG